MIEDKYINHNLDGAELRWYNYLIKDKGGIMNALMFLLKGLDCTKIYPDGSRPVQTINYGYRTDIAGFIYLNNKLAEENPECDIDFYAKLVQRHEENLSFEKDNPPIYYKGKQRISTRSTRRTAEIADIFTGEKSQVDVGTRRVVRPKDNVATRKAKALSSKSISFAFDNFKISK